MNCRDCQEKLDGYVDRELDDREMEVVRHHLAACPPCEDLYRLQANVKRLVRISCGHDRAPAHLREKLGQILF